MKWINIVLGVLLALLVAAGTYFIMGTDMGVDAAVAREENGLRCDVTLSNGSLFKYEYLEFIPVSPEGAELAAVEGTGGDVSPLSQTTVSFTTAGFDPCRVEIGYYVLGRRKSVTVNVE